MSNKNTSFFSDLILLVITILVTGTGIASSSLFIRSHNMCTRCSSDETRTQKTICGENEKYNNSLTYKKYSIAMLVVNILVFVFYGVGTFLALFNVDVTLNNRNSIFVRWGLPFMILLSVLNVVVNIFYNRFDDNICNCELALFNEETGEYEDRESYRGYNTALIATTFSIIGLLIVYALFRWWRKSRMARAMIEASKSN